MQMVRTSRPYSCSASAGVLGRLLACSLAMSKLAVVCRGVLPRWRGPDVGGPAPWGAHDAGFALQLATVRWPGMVLADPLAVPRSTSWPAAASPGYRPVSLGPGPAGGCRRAGNRPATEPSAADRRPGVNRIPRRVPFR
jgi:hypothetical protein